MLPSPASLTRSRVPHALPMLALLIAIPGSARGQAQSTAPAEEVPTIVVSNAEELLGAIGSNRIIRLGPGEYDLVAVVNRAHMGDVVGSPEFVSYVHPWGTAALVIHHVQNLQIIGPSDGREGVSGAAAHLVHRNPMADVLWFDRVQNLTVENVVAGHGVEVGPCSGSVFRITNSSDVTVRTSRLYGSGSVGLQLEASQGVVFESGIIDDVTGSLIEAVQSSEARISDASLVYGAEYNAFWVDSSTLLFERTDLRNGSAATEPMFYLLGSAAVSIAESTIESTQPRCLGQVAGSVALDSTTVSNVRECGSPCPPGVQCGQL